MASRRHFVLAVAAVGLAQRANAAQVDEADETAVGLGYRHDSAQVDAKKYPQHQATQRCANCQFWQGAATDAWSGCAMFGRKQVNAGGWCVAYKKV
jgi:hypothetical protein